MCTCVCVQVALIGALGCVPLAVVYPALCHWRLRTRPGGVQEGRILTKDMGIAIFGATGVGVAVVCAIRNWIAHGASAPQKCIATHGDV